VCESVDERHQEADVVDPPTVGRRRAAAVGPGLVDAVGIGHDEPEFIGDPVVVRQRGLRTSVCPAPCRLMTRPAG